MIKHEIENPVDRGNIIGENTFSIKASATAFQILSSGLYSDKILAIVRELSCNAYDSHVMAGKANVPIEIKLPTSLDPTFHVKDFGTGLSDEQIRGKLVDTTNSEGQVIGSIWEGGLYRTYFDSTKTDSNDYIGALGLGSKSPFSYVSTFTVESRYNGIKMIYSCFINEIGVPSIVKLGEQETDEENGLTVSLSAKKDDSGKFHSAARRTLMYFDPQPTIIGYRDFEPYRLSHTFAGSNWKIRINEYSANMRGPQVVQGFVAYPIDGSLLKQHGLSQTAAVLAGMPIDFTVDIGQVEVAASREALSYDQRTIKNLCDIFEQAAKELYSSIQKRFDDCETKWEAMCLVDKLQLDPSYEFRELFRNLHKDKPFIWNNNTITDKPTLDLSKISGMTISKYIGYSGGRVRRLHKWTHLSDSPTIHANSECGIVVDTISNGAKSLYEQCVMSLPMNKHNSKILYVISPANRFSYNQTEVDDIIAQMGSPVYVKAADIGIVKPKKVYNKTTRDKQERLVWGGFDTRRDYHNRDTVHRVFSNQCWNREIVDLSKGGYYVRVDRFTITHNNKDMEYFDNILNSAVKLGIYSSIPTVYGFREHQLDKLPKIHNWINILDEIKDKYIQLDKDKRLTHQLIYNGVITRLSNSVNDLFIEPWSTIVTDIEDGKFKQFFQRVVDMTIVNPLDDDAIHWIRRSFDIMDKTSDEVQAIIKDWEDLCTKDYDILSCISFHNLSIDDRNILIKHINLIEKTR